MVKNLNGSSLRELYVKSFIEAEREGALFLKSSSGDCVTRVATKSGSNNFVLNPSFESTGASLLSPFPDVKRKEKTTIKPFKKADASKAEHWHTIRGEALVVGKNAAERNPVDKCICMRATSTSEQNAVYQCVFVNQTQVKPLAVSVDTKSWQVSGSKNRGYAMTVDVIHEDGRVSYGAEIMLETGDNGWHRKCIFISSDKRVRALQVYLVFDSHKGVVHFDDVSVEQKNSLSETSSCELARLLEMCPFETSNLTQSLLSEEDPQPNTVTLASQLTVDRLLVVKQILESWEGPLSLAVLLLEEQHEKILIDFRERNRQICKRVDFHLVHAPVTFHPFLVVFILFKVKNFSQRSLLQLKRLDFILSTL